jgi:hypothetical protein
MPVTATWSGKSRVSNSMSSWAQLTSVKSPRSHRAQIASAALTFWVLTASSISSVAAYTADI